MDIPKETRYLICNGKGKGDVNKTSEVLQGTLDLMI